MKELANHIKTGNFARCYLFFGPEAFLSGRWRQSLIDAALPKEAREMNMEIFSGKLHPAARIMEAAETMPFLAQRRLVIVQDSGLFQGGRKDDSESMTNFVADIPESTVIIFAEDDVDKRGRLYKAVSKHGAVMEAKTPKEADLANWAVKLCASLGAKLPKHTAIYLLRNTAADMSLLHNEIAKLAAYKLHGEITNADVDAVCTKSLEAKIFDLMRAIGSKDAKRAAVLYANLIAAKESPLMVLTMLARQFRFYLQCAHLAAKMSQKDIAAKLALHPFAVSEFIEGSRGFSRAAMLAALEACLETDYAIKSGQMGDAMAVEILIIKTCAKYDDMI
ncbi:MAG: DNA polymerase III subunit delta [Clostridiales bacterium]|jgi:DNA polymerase-3 subunit delta|nr:DNA polymerase III subunit delta [Clostridiales bacterium]